MIPTILVATVMVAGIFAFLPVEQASTVHDTIIANLDGADDEDLTTMKDTINTLINNAEDTTQGQIAALIELEADVDLNAGAVLAAGTGTAISTVDSGAVGFHIIHIVDAVFGTEGNISILVDGTDTLLDAEDEIGETFVFVGITVSVLDDNNANVDATFDSVGFIILTSANPADPALP